MRLLRMLLVGMLLAGLSSAYDVPDDASKDVNEQSLRQELDPYGRWVRTNWGEVWQPGPGYVATDFQPYVTGGYWVSTVDGWSFVSSMPFGWVVFHYGQWVLDPMYGWVWVPGTVWAPSWVEWRTGGGYIGWAPLRPPGWGGSWNAASWCFVGAGDFLRPDVGHHRRRPEGNAAHYRATAPLDGGHAPHHGPPEADVSRAAGLPVKPAPALRSPRMVPPPPLAPHATPPPVEQGASPMPGPSRGGTFGTSPVPTHPRPVPDRIQPLMPPPVVVPVIPPGQRMQRPGPRGGQPPRPGR